MAGYNGYSMSNNAIWAYNDGEMPLSKWSKSNILESIENLINNEKIEAALSLEELKKLPTYILRKLLSYSGWHHTSSKYNKTDFYSINEELLISLTKEKVELFEKEHKEELKEVKEVTYYYAEVEYGVWEGTRKHPKLVMESSKALIVGNWAYLLDYSISKKKIDGKHFEITKQYGSRKPNNFDKELSRKAKEIALKGVK